MASILRAIDHYLMNSRQKVALICSIVLFIGVFTPIISVPFEGDLNYVQNGQGDGIIILVFAILGGFGAFLDKRVFLWIAGLGSLAVLALTFISLQLKMTDIHDSMEQQPAGYPFRGIAYAAAVQLQWGWGLLVLGAIGVTAGAGIKDQAHLRHFAVPPRIDPPVL